MQRLEHQLESVGHDARAHRLRRRFKRVSRRRRSQVLASVAVRLLRSACFAVALFAGGFCATLYWETQNSHQVSLVSEHTHLGN